MVSNMSEADLEKLQARLRERSAIPDDRLDGIPLQDRAEVREFVMMDPEDQRITLYTESRMAAVQRESLKTEMNAIGIMVRSIAARGSTWKVALVNASATIVAVGAVLIAAMNGKIPQ